jgi:bifunctional enzyme CysN/CysC
MSNILKFLTCGSVDDGKSTLIGNILYATGNIYEDQLKTLEAESKKIGNAGGKLDYSLLLDGLMAEREQGITIDVAYRYFFTPKTKFIVADTPGHVQYTRNMATGASNCDAALILIDARQGVLDQTRRHALICALMGIKNILFAINKMDLVSYDRYKYESIKIDCIRLTDDLKELGLSFNVSDCLPVSALEGDNLVLRSDKTPWYNGPTVLNWLEDIEPEKLLHDKAFRLPIQYVIKPGISEERWQNDALALFNPEEQKNFRGYAGKITSGSIKIDDEVIILPSGQKSIVKNIFKSDTRVSEVTAGDSVSISLAHDIDISRGDCIASIDSRPEMSDQFKARIVWMDETPLFSGRIYKFRSNFGTVNAEVVKINDRIDLSGYQKLAGEKLNMNDIGEIEISLSRPVPFDPYSENRETGSFILIDRLTNATSGCGMISHSLRRAQNVHWQNIEISKESRSRLMGQKPALLWLTGLSGAGKSTIANVIEKRLHSIGRHTMLLDGDNIRHGLNKDLGFNEADRIENIRRIGEVAKLMTDAGLIVITSFISPFRSERELARNLLPDGEFLEIFIDTPIEECEARDPKGLYRKARNGEIPNFTGINSPYEVPEKPEITLNTISTDADKLAEIVIKYMSDKGII